MDVQRQRVGLILFALSFTVLSSCAPEKTKTTVFNDNSQSTSSKLGDCDALTVKNKFIVQWMNGKFSVHEAPSKDEFLDGFVSENLREIKLVEYDELMQIKLQSEQVTLPIKATALQTWGQESIGAQAAWDQGYFGQGVTVGIVDTQIDVNHGLLRDQIAMNSGEIPNNGIDDDGNGYVDDYRGYVFVPECTPTSLSDDCQKHATHIAGIIAGTHQSTIRAPMKGLAPQAKIVQAAFLARNGGGDLSDAVLALQYAADRGSKIINASWGSSQCGRSLKNQISDLSSRGVLVMAAAGNNGADITYESNRVYPAAFQFSNLLVVAAGTMDHFMANFSNNSFTLVHVAAPGDEIYSSVPRWAGVDQYALMSGTSMATPFVSGAAALLMSARPAATPGQILQALKETVDTDQLHSYKVSTKGRINIAKALVRLKELVP